LQSAAVRDTRTEQRRHSGLEERMRNRRNARRTYGAGAKLFGLVAAMCVPLAVGSQEAVPPQPQEPAAGYTVAGEELVVYLMTVWPGDAIWESFGHNALWIRDQAAGTDSAYNSGIFDSYRPGFISRLI